MNFKKYTEGLEGNEGVPKNKIIEIEKELNFELPDDYKRFMMIHNGCEGPLGEGYIRIYPIDQLIEMNKGYLIDQHFPDFFVFGTDTGGEAYAFDTQFLKMPIVVFEFTNLHMEDVFTIADTFTNFLEYIYSDMMNEKWPPPCHLYYDGRRR